MNICRFSSSTRRLSAFMSILASLALSFGALTANAATVSVQNSDFSVSTNQGTVGGGLIGSPATSTIGVGPWDASYQGINLGLTTLAAPSLTIGSGKATVNGLIYASLVGLNNQASFHQVLGESIAPGMRYTLRAEIDAGSVLNLTVLGSGNAGIAIGNGVSRVASSRIGTPLLQLVTGTTYAVTVVYDAPAGASGSLEAILFAEPTGVLSASLLGSVSFDNVSLEKRAINQVPASVTPTTSIPPIATCGLPISPGISVAVLDVNGDPIPNLPVNYSAPTSGASLNPPTGSVLTNSVGVATFTPLANTIAGTYPVVVTVPSSGTNTTLTLTNLAGPAANVGALPGGTPSAVVNTAFSTPASALVVDQYGNPVGGATVLFSAPTNGASAALAATSAVTNGSGIASVGAVANALAGSYAVAVSVPSTGAQGSINLTNLAGPGTQVGPPGGVGGPIPSATVTTAFSSPAKALVTDQFGNPVQGVEVFFSAPASGASATLSAPSAITDATGIASVAAVANSIAGSYAVAVSVPSTGAQSTIPLTNTAGAPSSVAAPSGATPRAFVGQPLSTPVAAKVTDAFGNPVTGQTVTFTAPTSGASASLQPSSATTGSDGIARVNGTANMIAGDYVITSTAAGVSGNIPVLNLLPPTIKTNPDGQPEQSADVGEPFSCLLLVRVVDDQGVPQPNQVVDFEAPAGGASAQLSHDGTIGRSVRVPSDADGFAWVEATGNAATGTYAVTAKLAFSESEPAEAFKLRNAQTGDSAFSAGFDGMCVSSKPTP